MMRFKTEGLSYGDLSVAEIDEVFRVYEAHLDEQQIPCDVRKMSAALIDPIPLNLELLPEEQSARVVWITGTIPDGYFTTSVAYRGVSEETRSLFEEKFQVLRPSSGVLPMLTVREQELDRKPGSQLLIH